MTLCPLQVTVSSLHDVVKYFQEMTKYRLVPYSPSELYDTQIGQSLLPWRPFWSHFTSLSVFSVVPQICRLLQGTPEPPRSTLDWHRGAKWCPGCSQTLKISHLQRLWMVDTSILTVSSPMTSNWGRHVCRWWHNEHWCALRESKRTVCALWSLFAAARLDQDVVWKKVVYTSADKEEQPYEN